MTAGTWDGILNWLSLSPPQAPDSRGVKPPPPEQRVEKLNRLVRLQINPQGSVQLEERQSMIFTAVPFDSEGSAIHGLQAEWESSDRQVVFVRKDGEALAGKPGTATLTARAGSVTASVQVIVTKGDGEPFGKKKPDSTRNNLRARQYPSASENDTNRRIASRSKRRHHSATQRTSSAAGPFMFLRDPNDDPLPDNETLSLYKPINTVGAPPGRTRGGAPAPAPATGGTETNGNKNFTYALPVAGLPGRGINAALSLVYNSAVWNKSTAPSTGNTWMTYDVDASWPATGWRMTLGQIESQGSAGFTLVDADGTRHALTLTSTSHYDTTDGTFIHYHGGSSSGTLYYPDGTIATYGAGGGGYRLYPTRIQDRNGNYIVISYAGTSGAGPKISSIVDTLGRYINFYYASNGDLIAVTQPGLSSSDVQTIRFYYTDVTLSSGLFDSSFGVSAPTSVHTLQYVYFPTSSESSGAHTGYKFEYSPYGMVRQITKLRGMTVSSSSTSSAGSVTAEGAMAAQTTYSYPTSAQALTDVPTYSTRTDDWAGRTVNMSGGAPYYTFATNESTGVTTVTAPDQTITETHAIVNSGQWNDGLVSDTYIKSGSTTYAQTHIDWQLDSNNKNARPYQILTTDSLAGLTKATVLSYTTYNNVSSVSERDLTTNGTVSSTELRRTDTTYVTDSTYIGRRLYHLPASVKVYPGGSSTPISRVDYAYDNYGANHANLTARPNIIRHDPAYDPFQEDQESCDWECTEWGINETGYWGCLNWEWQCTYFNPYLPGTDYRGNVTSVTTYADAATPSGAITHAMTYDIAGNVTSAQVDCCQLKSFEYSDTYYNAYVTSVTRGNPSGLHLTSSATYSFNTGLVATGTDENSQVVTNYYNSDSLRLDHVTYPDGGATYLTYSDALAADANGKYHSYVDQSVKLDAPGGTPRYVTSRQFFDGRGATARVFSGYTSTNGWSAQDIEYDVMGRAYRSSNPYYASGNSAAINADGFWTTSSFDPLGRVTQVTMPRGDNNNSLTTSVSISYDGVYTTTTDQAGKTRRQKSDALGRMVRLDEPTSSGLGSTTSPNQATSYDYDVLDNLVHITQGAQHRYFKYDSLSRLIRERQVEQTANSTYNLSDSLTGNSSWTSKFEYNSHGLITNSYDARGVQATFSYDGLNRVTQISYSDSTPTAHYYYDSQSLPSGAPTYTQSNTTGRLLAATYGTSATGTYFAYDTMGRVVTQKQVTGSTTYSLSYAYNAGGLLTSETYPSGRSLAYSYDEGGRLSSLGDGTTTFASSFSYAPHGGLTSETWGNSAVHTLAFNRRLQPSQAKLTVSGAVQQQYDYSYGQFNTGTGAVDTSKNNGQLGKIDATIGTTAQWNQGFSYDELGRLTNLVEYQGSSMSTQTYALAYGYDRYGNRTQSANATLGLPAISSSDYDTSNNNNRFVSSVATYDAAGNITTDAKFRSLTYAYDANGRQKSATNGTWTQTQVYDCAGQRVQTTVGSTTRTMVYDAFGQTVAEYSGASLERENIYRGAALLATYEAGTSTLRYVLTDAQGSTRTILNSSGAVTARHDYLPFGEEIGAGIGLRTTGQGFGATDTNRQKYGLTERDDTSGLDHTWWRKYENKSGRWTSPDPLRGTIDAPQTFNAYAYAANDPVNFVDPNGLCTFAIALDDQANLDPAVLSAVQNRISEIFTAANQQVNFVPANSRSADFRLTIFSSPTAANRTEPSRVVGSTDLGRGRRVTNEGRIYVDRLTASATGDTASRILFNLLPQFLGYGLGTAGAHEIGHFLLQQNFDSSTMQGIMTASFRGTQWFGALRTFTAGQIERLNNLCALSTNPSVPSTSITLRPLRPTIRLGLGGINFFVSDPWWSQSLQEFLDWVNSIGRDPDVIVTACVGSDCPS
ncbi:MAG TPA: RHS repeat-associated core domain-containing protein [Pyrinomonadaceae bacterium]|nr:RHS repeat-associated core domain-containing protein [Pyrinomonadaceae bacterium]